MPKPTGPLCRDCRHHSHDAYAGEHYCRRKRVEVESERSLVTGIAYRSTVGEFLYAESERESRMPWRCGQKARYFALKAVA